MKKITLIAVTALLSLTANSQTITWYDTPDGTYAPWGDWAYKDILIPAGQKVDSVYGAFTRSGYPADEEDFIFSFSSGAIFDGGTATSPWNYLDETSSLYSYWIDLTSFNYEGQGVVRIGLPTPAGAIWDSVGVATSYFSSASIDEFEFEDISIYPNPASELITIRSKSLEEVIVVDLLGKTILIEGKEQETKVIEVIELPSGTYFIRQGLSIVKFIKN